MEFYNESKLPAVLRLSVCTTRIEVCLSVPLQIPFIIRCLVFRFSLGLRKPILSELKENIQTNTK